MLNEVLAVGITGAGCPGAKGIIEALKGFEIVGFDSNVDNVAIAPYLARLHNVLPGSDSNYIVDLLPKLEDVDVLLPCTSDELLPLALAVEDGLIPCPVVVSSSKAISIANNKFKLSKMFANHAPATILANGNNVIAMAKTLGYPEKKVIVKPIEGSGSRGLMILSALAHKDFINKKPEESYYTSDEANDRVGKEDQYVVQEFIEGDEYSVDCYFSETGNFAVPRIRHKVRSGIAFDTEIDMNQYGLRNLSFMMGKELGLKYCAGFQFIIETDTEKPYLIECNPRVQGSMPIVTAFQWSYNPFYRAIEECLGREVNDVPDLGCLHGFRMKRVWGGITTRNSQLIKEF